MDFSLFFFSADESNTTKNKYRLLLESATFADKHGYAAVWTPERHFHSFGGLYPNPAVIGAALATITERIQIRAGSVVLPLQNPIRVAEEWSVVDNLSNGRAAISFASGWHANDFVLFPQNYDRRRDLMYEGIETIQRLWKGDKVSLPNGVGNIVETSIFPRPIQRELPVWISCHSRETFEKAGMMGANVVTAMYFLTIEELTDRIALYRKALSKNGHDKNKGSVALMIHTFLGDNMDVVREKVKSAYVDYLLVNLGLHSAQAKGSGQEFEPSENDKEYMMSAATERLFNTGLIGTLETSLKKVETLRQVGVDEIACLIDFGIDFDSVMTGLYQLNRLKELVNSDVKVGRP
jgi:natural product biosynthesis luciferase-like monooxygenase protein